jgi:hypothetical protein
MNDLELVELQEFNDLLEEGHINISPDAISLAYVLQNDRNLWEVYTNSGFKVGEFPEKDLAMKKATSMRLYAKNLVGDKVVESNANDTWNPETGKTPPSKSKDQFKEDAKKERQYLKDENIISPPELDDNKGHNLKDLNLDNPNPTAKVADIEKPPTEIETVPLMENDKILKEFTLFRDGEWDFEKDLGFTFKVDKEFRNKILENWKNKTRGQRIPIVDSHDPGKPAYGWVSSIYNSEDNNKTMMKIRWNKYGNEILSNEKYGYHSPQAKFDYYDPETKRHYGPTLIEVSLTNSPRIKTSSAVLAEFSEDFTSDYSNECIKLECNSINKNKILGDLIKINSSKSIPKKDKEKFIQNIVKIAKSFNIEISSDVNLSEGRPIMFQSAGLLNEFNNLTCNLRSLGEFIPSSMETKYFGNTGLMLVIGKSILSDTGEYLCQSIKFDTGKWDNESASKFIDQFDLIDRAMYQGSNFINDMECNHLNMIEQFSNKYNNILKEDDFIGKEKEGWVQEIMEEETMIMSTEITPISEPKADNVDGMLASLIGKVMNFFSQKEKECEKKEEETMAIEKDMIMAASEEVKKEELAEGCGELKLSEEVKLPVVDSANIQLLLSEIVSLKQENSELKSKNSNYEILLSEAKEKEAEAKDNVMLEELITDGKLYPMDKEIELAQLKKYRAKDNKDKLSGISLSEGEVCLEEDYRDKLKNKSKVVNYNKETGSSFVPTEGVSLEETIMNEASQMSTKEGIGLSDAILVVNQKYNYQPPRMNKGGN